MYGFLKQRNKILSHFKFLNKNLPRRFLDIHFKSINFKNMDAKANNLPVDILFTSNNNNPFKDLDEEIKGYILRCQTKNFSYSLSPLASKNREFGEKLKNHNKFNNVKQTIILTKFSENSSIEDNILNHELEKQIILKDKVRNNDFGPIKKTTLRINKDINQIQEITIDKNSQKNINQNNENNQRGNIKIEEDIKNKNKKNKSVIEKDSKKNMNYTGFISLKSIKCLGRNNKNNSQFNDVKRTFSQFRFKQSEESNFNNSSNTSSNLINTFNKISNILNNDATNNNNTISNSLIGNNILTQGNESNSIINQKERKTYFSFNKSIKVPPGKNHYPKRLVKNEITNTEGNKYYKTISSKKKFINKNNHNENSSVIHTLPKEFGRSNFKIDSPRANNNITINSQLKASFAQKDNLIKNKTGNLEICYNGFHKPNLKKEKDKKLNIFLMSPNYLMDKENHLLGCTKDFIGKSLKVYETKNNVFLPSLSVRIKTNCPRYERQDINKEDNGFILS